VKKFIKIY